MLSPTAMQLRDLAFIAIFSGLLPWWTVRIIVLMNTYSPGFLGFLKPNSSATSIAILSGAQWLFEALVVAVPVAVVLAWITRSSATLLAAAIVVGYSAAFFIWGLFASASLADLVRSFIVPNHILLVLMLGLCAFTFRKLFASKAGGA